MTLSVVNCGAFRVPETSRRLLNVQDQMLADFRKSIAVWKVTGFVL